MSHTSAATSRFETASPVCPSRPVARLQRGDGAVEVVFRKTGGRTGLSHLYQKTPCRVLFPKTHRGELLTGVVLTTSGGLAGGDRIRLELSSRADAEALMTSQAAEKIYRSDGTACIVDTRVDAGSGSWFEWMPQETILFDRSRLHRSTTINAAPGAEIIAGDVMVFGRLAHGEIFCQGSLRDAWKVLYNGRPAWLDTLVLDAAAGAPLTHPARFNGARAMATFVYVAPRAMQHIETARALLATCPIRCGVTGVNGVLIARFLAREPHALRAEYSRFWSAFRAAVKGLPARVPRVWEC